MRCSRADRRCHVLSVNASKCLLASCLFLAWGDRGRRPQCLPRVGRKRMWPAVGLTRVSGCRRSHRMRPGRRGRAPGQLQLPVSPQPFSASCPASRLCTATHGLCDPQTRASAVPLLVSPSAFPSPGTHGVSLQRPGLAGHRRPPPSHQASLPLPGHPAREALSECTPARSCLSIFFLSRNVCFLS